MSGYPKVLHEWTLAGYSGRIVETEPGIVTSEQAMDDDRLGRLWLSNRSPIGWPNEMIQLALSVTALRAELAQRDERIAKLTEACETARGMLRMMNVSDWEARSLAFDQLTAALAATEPTKGGAK